MNIEQLFHNFFAPPVPFFFLGLIAILLKSDLEIPSAISKFISLYLLMAIGFKGGVELHHSGISSQVILVLVVSVIMAIVIPIYSYRILRTKLDVPNAAALAASFGSVSAVTFITASNILNEAKIAFGGEMVAAMALMESPSIIIGVIMYRKLNKETPEQIAENEEHGHNMTMKELLREAFLNGSIVVLLGSLIIGLISNEKGMKIMEPFTGNIFKGMLSFFLLDMGVIAGRRIGALKEAGWQIIAFGILIPIINAAIGIGLSFIMGLDQGNSFMFTVLMASASYIAVPAAMRIAVPDANPGIYVPVALAITFPFNIIAGLPIYYYILEKIHGIV